MLNISWDPVLIAISYLVAFIASFVALDSAGKIPLSSRKAALFWRIAGGVTLGIGIWSMHFIGMLSMQMPMMMSYDLWLTLASLGVAVIASATALNIAVAGKKLSPFRLIFATAILSAGVVSMHYIGMAALMLDGSIIWDRRIVGLSVVIAVVASGTALWLAFRLRDKHKGVFINRILAAFVMGAAICAMHYTGMSAAQFQEMAHTLPGGIGELGLSIWVSVTTLCLLGVMLIISLIDSHRRTSRLTDNLHQLNRQLELQARFDALTGLANRHQMDLRMQDCLRSALLSKKPFAVIFLDVDHFKRVNDTWGHSVGDELLIAVAQRITARLTREMTLARLGGDAFILLVPECDDDRLNALVTALLEDVRRPLSVCGHTLSTTISAGVSLYPQDGETLHELKLKADAALHRVKEEGRNGWAIYRAEMSTAIPAKPGFLQELSQALERDQFELWYQPTWHAGEKTIHGFEALLRWRHPEQGVVLPNLFIPSLEQTGLIIPVGNWAIEAACRQLHFWTEQGFSQWTLSLNLSPIQFEQPDIFQIVSSMLEKYSLSPSRLILEVTESTALKNLDRSIELLNAFNHAGIVVSIDDFGTGYSNLLMLSVLPAKELKIDRSFVTSMLENEKSYKLVETIISIARTMEMNVVAEGIETEEQQAVLTRLGCDYLQGYLFSRPLPAEQVPWLLLQINSDKQIIPINKIQTDPAFISQKNHA
ncbi:MULTISPECIES: putative bifunctional diguanylate cyclase/phosphodiesterase [Enterobacter]|uniref:putative bifunctional diguanylate cyclase/phosphodiesterase n=1 Tax=Enterobacter TaxID=547 RepID=UPI000EF9FAEE|nr:MULTISPECIES: bifunctional diguanylate cyclase/phosphodiesterase [Enterobacter]MCK2176432.1 EAL domain-containing protein [Enterobacter asburiae]MDU0845758.1 bifunctional diguanylate cyclase/phosphodiesterase [Enterobacter asburiae]MDU0856141.1 bifunctional diguanylate cyclase/phosphodiesterase [Enterobacter asburiae]RMA89781.1 diguanylate cyclase (GGDEF)-like protein [Enterobacter sp. WP_7_1]RMA99749.1 diguanylate cyclase (GGDEF)-like protein [Enterobacter sp. WP_7_2]